MNSTVAGGHSWCASSWLLPTFTASCVGPASFGAALIWIWRSPHQGCTCHADEEPNYLALGQQAAQHPVSVLWTKLPFLCCMGSSGIECACGGWNACTYSYADCGYTVQQCTWIDALGVVLDGCGHAQQCMSVSGGQRKEQQPLAAGAPRPPRPLHAVAAPSRLARGLACAHRRSAWSVSLCGICHLSESMPAELRPPPRVNECTLQGVPT
jgi:hypothetical protein